MHRIDTPTASANENGTGKAGFRDGSPPSTLAPTDLNADWFNAVQEEIANTIEGTGIALVKATKTQLFTAINALHARAAAKAALGALKLVGDTGTSQALRAAARKASTRRIVAVGDNGTIVSSDGSTSFTTEPPGSVYAGDFVDIVYNTTIGLFVAAGTAGEIQSSPDGQTWTQRATGGSNIRALATNGGSITVAVGDSEFIKSSTSGTLWTTRTSPFAGTPHITSVAFGAGLFVMVTAQNDIATSPDGVTWTVRRATAGTTTLRARVAYHSSLGFLYHWGTLIYHSADGITWSTLHSSVPSSTTSVPGLCTLPYVWLIVAASGMGGAYVDARFSVSATEAASDFTIDFANGDNDLEWLGVLDGQVWALADDRVFAGGAL